MRGRTFVCVEEPAQEREMRAMARDVVKDLSDRGRVVHRADWHWISDKEFGIWLHWSDEDELTDPERRSKKVKV